MKDLRREMVISASKDEWLQARVKMLNSTEVSALFPGCNPYLSLPKLWYQKYMGVPDVRKTTPAMQAGLDAEPEIAARVGAMRGWKVKEYPPFMTIQMPDLRLGASLDRQLPDLGCPLELKKCEPSPFLNGSWKIHQGRVVKVSPYVEIQMNVQMFVGGFEQEKLGIKVGLNSFYSGDWRPNPTLMRMVLGRTEEFWNSIDRGWAPKGLSRLRSVDLSLLPDKIRVA